MPGATSTSSLPPTLQRWLATANLVGGLVPDDLDGHPILLVQGPAFVPVPVEVRNAVRRALPELEDVEVLVVPDAMPYGGEVVDHDTLDRIRRDGVGSRYVAAGNDLERWLGGVWSELLDLPEPIGATDHFIELGGDSIGVLELVGRVEGAFAIEVDIEELFEHLVLREMADLLAGRVE